MIYIFLIALWILAMLDRDADNNRLIKRLDAIEKLIKESGDK